MSDQLYSVLVYRLPSAKGASPVCLARHTHSRRRARGASPCVDESTSQQQEESLPHVCHDDDAFFQSAVSRMIQSNLSSSSRKTSPPSWEPGTLGGFQKRVVQSCHSSAPGAVSASCADAGNAAAVEPYQVVFGQAHEPQQLYAGGKRSSNVNKNHRAMVTLCLAVVTGPDYPDRVAIQLLHETYKRCKTVAAAAAATTNSNSCRSMQAYGSERSTSSGSAASCQQPTQPIRERLDSACSVESFIYVDSSSDNRNGATAGTATAATTTAEEKMETILREACVKYDELNQFHHKIRTQQLAKDLNGASASDGTVNQQQQQDGGSSQHWCHTAIEPMGDGNETTATSSSSSCSSSIQSSSSSSSSSKLQKKFHKVVSWKNNLVRKLGGAAGKTTNKKRTSRKAQPSPRQKSRSTAATQTVPQTGLVVGSSEQEVSA